MLRFFDGFDYYDNDGLQFNRTKWDQSNNNYLAGGQPGRLDGKSMQITAGAGGISKNFEGRTTYIMGAAISLNKTAGGGVYAISPLIKAMDSSGDQVHLRVNSSGVIELWTPAGVLMATATGGPLPFGFPAWFYLEWKVTIDAAAGYSEIRIDKVPVLIFNGNTKGASGSTLTGFRIQGVTGAWHYIDDFYLCDTQGTVNNSFLGNCHVTAQLPTADGTRGQWVPSTAGAHALMVDDPGAQVDDDATYISSGNPGDIDTFKVSTPPGTKLIFGAQLNIQARKDDAGARTISAICKPAGGVDQIDTARVLIQANYQNFTTLYEKNPATGVAWTQAEIAAAEWGIKEVT